MGAVLGAITGVVARLLGVRLSPANMVLLL